MARVGKYELVRKLARGGMAEVFLARSEWARGLEKPVVVKRILDHLAAEPRFIEMFFSEAKLASQLSHPNIAQIIEFGEADGVNYLAMEYVDGPSVRGLLKVMRACDERMPFGHAARIVASACEALAYAHDLTDPRTGRPLQLVHRDISPDNILISKTGAVKVVDFGIAKAATQTHHTNAGTVKGKLAYMPPEQLRAEPLDRRADVYALGVVLYELIAGTKPYDPSNRPRLMDAIRAGDRPPLQSRRPDTPAALERIVDQAMDCDREARYADCREMYAELEQFLVSLRPPVSAFQLAELLQRYDTSGSGDRASEGQGKGDGAPEPGSTRTAPEPPPPAERTRPQRSPSRRALHTPHGAEEEGAATGAGPTDVSRERAAEGEGGGRAMRAAESAGRPSWPLIGGVAAGLVVAGAAGWMFLGAGADPVPVQVSQRTPVTAVLTATPPPAETREDYRAKVQDLLGRATVYVKEGDDRHAEPLLLACVDLDADKADCHLELGALYDRQKDPRKAERYYREFLHRAAEDPRAAEVQQKLRALAALPESATRSAGSESDLAAQRSAGADQFYKEGQQLLKQRQYREASELFRTCIRLDPSDPECHLALGSAYARLREPEKGAQEYRTFLDLAPNHERAGEIRKLLEEWESQVQKGGR